jgi:superfamily II DNA/RNA helicase
MIPPLTPISEPDQILAELEAVTQNQRFQNFVAQTHSREILERLRVPQEAWPRYTVSDDDLHYTSHFLLWQGLQLKLDPNYQDAADEYIKQGCEILEFLYNQAAVGTADRIDQIFNAAIGYYISGYYAGSYVLMRDLGAQPDLPQELALLRNLFQKNLTQTRSLISSIVSDPSYSDSGIATLLRGADVSQDDALDRILLASLNRAISYFIEFPKTGIRSLLETARAIADRGIQLSLRTGFADWWWLFYCVRFLFDEYDANSLWTVLSPLQGDDTEGKYVRPYIRANYSRPSPVIELWRSQKAALPQINEPKRPSYCIKMPTSAGKTRIAEIAILRFLLDFKDDPGSKCIYVAPFRSLAVEIEGSLKESFHALGVRVSELYGGFELSPIERLLMDETRVVVATPEKVDVFLRINPEYLDQIRLVIIDEGHIISLSERGIHYEFFIERLIRLLRPKGVRFLFMSAVLPNAQEFAQWITGNPENVIGRDWRPSRLLLGNLIWERRRARIEYFESDHAPLGHECFVRNLLLPRDLHGIQGIRRNNPYPNDFAEVVAETSLRFAQQGLTMIFCSRKASVGPMAGKITTALKIHSRLEALGEAPLQLDIEEQHRSDVEECVRLANEYMGDRNIVADCLRQGFVIHHASIPKTVRLKLEELVRSHAIRLIVASATLAQGVNLPIQTVIVYGLSHGEDDDLTPITFWNICGRAGRGMQENEGQILFAVDKDLPGVRLNNTSGLSSQQIARRTEFKRRKTIERQDETRDHIVHAYNSYRVLSSLNMLLNLLKKDWEKVHGNVDVAAMCTYLAESNLDWVSSYPQKVVAWLDTVDQGLLALAEEAGLDPISPDMLQQVLAGALAFLQLEDQNDPEAAKGELIDFLFARAKYIARYAQNPIVRKKYYKLGLPLRDCARIAENEQVLGELLNSAKDYMRWDEVVRCQYLQRISEFLLTQIGALAPYRNTTQSCWSDVLALWLGGDSPNEISADQKVAQCVNDPVEISAFIEDAFVYKLPRGLNALTAFFADIAKETGFDLPAVVSYFPALIKYGVHDPVASCLLAFNIESRKLALHLAQHYPHPEIEPNEVLAWFLDLDKAGLARLGFAAQEIVQIDSAQKWSRSFRQRGVITPEVTRLRLTVSISSAQKVSEGDILVLHPRPDLSPHIVSIETLSGEELGQIELEGAIPSDWLLPHTISVQIESKVSVDQERMMLQIAIESF